MTQEKGKKLAVVQRLSNFLEKIKSSKKPINKPDYDIDRGFEFILTGGKKKSKPIRGTATKKEEKELKKEGVPYIKLPLIKDN